LLEGELKAAAEVGVMWQLH